MVLLMHSSKHSQPARLLLLLSAGGIASVKRITTPTAC
jgi:hypothetical protein